MDIAARFGDNLYRARKRTGLSQEELGFRSGLHRTEIGLLERGSRIPRIDTLVKLSGALSVSPLELIDGIEWAPASTLSGGFQIEGADPDED
jgi:transcriptional regulator with XRE-family HTH domain